MSETSPFNNVVLRKSPVVQLKLTTLTPVHIGSGKTLNADIDFFIQGNQVAFIDDQKILKLLGSTNLVQRIEQWAVAIATNQSLRGFLTQQAGPGVFNDLKNFASRISTLKSNNPTSRNLKEHYRTALQGLCIPGSSLKGAMTTLLLAELLDDAFLKKTLKTSDISTLKKKKDGGSRLEFQDKYVMQKFFGNNPNKSINRFLKVFDAPFPEVNSEVHELKVLNITNFHKSTWGFKPRQHMLIECIPAGVSTTFSLKLDHTWLQRNREKNAHVWKNKKTEHLSDIYKFLQSLNKKELKILTDDVHELSENGIDNHPSGREHLKNLEKIFDICEKCRSGEAVLRVGGHVGWTYTTGSWVRYSGEGVSDDDFKQLRKAIQKKEYPLDTMWPKTRKTTDQGTAFGFVKLECIN
ncbi:MAG: hypothetical protein KatS3mg031_2762 [Chitinophagales bacterium]|nr:MAG: hypothetical protein KatS3mg031_2762 [Chitinophagales bacterium]